MSRLQQNKSSAMAFYELMFNQRKPRQAIEEYVGAEYIQHNSELADGKEAFMEYFERLAVEFPNKKVTFKRAIAEGDHVVLHCHQDLPWCTYGALQLNSWHLEPIRDNTETVCI